METLDFESVNAKIEQLDLEALEMQMARKDVAVSQVDLCAIWKKIGSIIRLIASWPLPAKWKAALQLLIKVLDSLCP